MHAIQVLRRVRSLIIAAVEPLSEMELRYIPAGFRNNVLWNLGHLVVTQQLLHYGQSGLPLLVPDEVRDQFRRGTSPAEWTRDPDSRQLLELAAELPIRLEEDYRVGRFERFQTYTTMSGVILSDIDAAISFNNYHEGLHMGVISSMKRLLAKG